MSLVHLHVHTCFSLLDGLSHPKKLAARAAEMGQNALAVTDHGVMYGIIDHYKACQAVGIKPIMGCELYVTQDHTVKDKAVLSELPSDNHHLVALARTDEGHENLRRLVSIAMMEGFYYKPRVDDKLLQQYGRGIIALSGCLAGEIPQLLLRGEYEQAKAKAKFYSQIFDQFYLEIQANHIPEQHVVNELLKQMSEETGLPLVVTCDSHFILKEDGKAHRDFTVLGGTKGDWEAVYADAWLKSEEEILEMGIPQVAIDNTQHIADLCNVTIQMGAFHLPEFQVPEGYTLDTFLSRQCQDGLFRIMMEDDIDIERYFARLEYELDVVRRKGLSGYFLIVQDFVQWAKKQGIMVGPGRGSAAGSLIAYTLGITQLDPMKHGLLFERFLNPERPSMPDIDMDFEDVRRSEVMQYLVDKYGASNVCQVITFGTMLSRMVLKDAARILDMDFEMVNNITKKIPVHEGRPYSLQESIDHIPEVAQAAKDYPELFELAQSLEGIPRHAGTHAAGVVVAPDELVKFIPLSRGKEGEAVSQFTKDTVEDLGLLKFDLLGLKTLTVMKLALDMIKKNHGVDIDLSKVPLDDKITLDLIKSGQTIGVFQLESEGMQSIFKNLNNVTFDALVAGISLYRPGPMDLIPAYTDGFNGIRHVDYLVPELEPVLKDTFGVILYQEQTMKIATDLAGYTPGQSDMLRKAIGKKKREVMEKELHKLVYGDEETKIPGMAKRGIPETSALEIANMIEKFAGYGFNKSHATGYAILALQAAYLKARYPLEFMCALMTVAIGTPDKVTRYAHEAKRMGAKMLLPDINQSETGFSTDGNAIRFALSAIKGIGPNVAERLVATRPFNSLEDLIERLSKKELNKKALYALCISGALDQFGGNRMAIYRKLLQFRDDKDTIEEETIKAFDDKSKLKLEEEVLGFFVSGHPLLSIAKKIDWTKVQDGKPFEMYCTINTMKVVNTKKGDPMCTLTVETLEGQKTVIVFTQVYASCKDDNALKPGLVVKLKVVKDARIGGLVAREVKVSKKYNKV